MAHEFESGMFVRQPGNLYMVSSEQAFALPIRVHEFEKIIKNKVYQELKFGEK